MMRKKSISSRIKRRNDSRSTAAAETVQQRKALQILKAQIVKKQPTPLEFHSLQNMALWIIAEKDFWKV